MNDIVKYEKRYKYTHMKPNDVELWERFIEKYPTAYDTCIYDFNVGDSPAFNPMGDDGEDLNQDALYKLKIDVVAFRGNEIDIIELKPKAGPSSIGQIRAYKTIFERDEKPKQKVNMVIITDTVMPNMAYMVKIENVKLVVV